MINPNQETQDRQIRVFVSSTFRDMQVERELLVKQVFPELRRLCAERFVTFTEVDLRWGITEEQASEGKVLPICLEEIHRCRPYFIGLLGERYGWIPESVPQEIIEREPWLKEHVVERTSVTELEIVHGVLNDRAMADHSFFYFRDPTYIDSIPDEDRKNYIAESESSAEKLKELKQRIRKSGLPILENYENPIALAEAIREQFTALIDQLYPKEEVPDPLDQEAARHEAYARSRRFAFVGREDLLCRLDEHANAPGGPLVLTGESGCGKSALLAEWVARWRKSHPDDLIIQHYIGSTSHSADWQGLVFRILSELKSAFAIADEIPIQPDALRTVLRDWMAKAAGPQQVVIVLDALNQLAEDGAARELGWLPVVFPANFRLIVSTLPGESLDALRQRNWSVLDVPVFSRADIAPTARAFCEIFSKTLPSNIEARLESTPAACNALYLRAVLDELRQFGIHEELEARAGDYLAALNPSDLFDRILSRWHDDFGSDQEYPDIVRRALCFVACARYGLSETELLDLLGKNGEPMPRRFWTPFYLAAENALALRTGLLNFSHEYLREAVEKRWLADSEVVRQVQLELAEFHARESEPTDRKLDELPWLLFQTKEWDRLSGSLIEIATFLRMRQDRWKWDLHGYWLTLQQYRDPVAEYERAFLKWEAAYTGKLDARHRMMTALAEFHQDRGEYHSTESWLHRALDSCEKVRGQEAQDTLAIVSKLGNLLHITGNHKAAEPLLRRVVGASERQMGLQNPLTIININNLAAFLESKGDYEGAEPLYRQCLAEFEKQLGPEHPKTLMCINNLANLLSLRGRTAAAEPLYERAMEARIRLLGREHPDTLTSISCWACALMDRGAYNQAESLLREVQDARERLLGVEHPDTLTNINNLASVLRAKGDYAAAESLFRQALATRERMGGATLPETLHLRDNLGGLLCDKGDYVAAESLCRRSLEESEETLGPDHPSTLVCVSNLVALLRDKGEYANAQPLCQRVLEASKRVLGEEHPNTLSAMSNLGGLLELMGDGNAAEVLFRRVLEIQERVLGLEHHSTVTTTANLAYLLMNKGNLTEAEKWFRQVVAVREQNLGVEHPTTLIAISNLAGLLKDKREYAAAEQLQRRILEVRKRVLGSNHPDTLRNLQNLASLLESMGESAEAESLYRKSLRTMEDVLGPEHPDTLVALNNLALFLTHKGDNALAEPMLRRALEMEERVLGPNHPSTLRSVENLAGTLEDSRDFTAAAELYRRALDIRDQIHGPEHPDTAIAVYNLARTLNQAEDYEAAEPLYRRALLAMERSLGPDHKKTLAIVNNLAALFCSQERYDDAEPLHRRVLESHERVLGPEHPMTLVSLDNLAGLLAAKGDYETAETLHRRSLETLERVEGPEHPDTLTAANNLAVLHLRKGDYAAAGNLLRNALKSLDRVLGEEHTNTMRTLNALIVALMNQSDFGELAPLLERKLKWLLRSSVATGDHHPDLQSTLRTYASILEQMGVNQAEVSSKINKLCRPFGLKFGGDESPEPPELGRAQAVFGQAVKQYEGGDYTSAKTSLAQSIFLWQQARGPDDLQLAALHFELATVEERLKDLDGAVLSLRRALEIREDVLGPEHQDTLTILTKLVIVLADRGDNSSAEQLQRRLFKARVRGLGENHPDTLASLSDLAGLLTRQGKFDEAETHYQKALENARLALGVNHELTTRIKRNLAALHRMMLSRLQEEKGITPAGYAALADHLERSGDFQMALMARSECVRTEAKLSGEKHPKVAVALSQLALLLWQLGRPAEAEPILRQAIEIEEESLPADSAEHPLRLNSLAIVLVMQGKTAEAVDLLERAWTLKTKYGRHDLTSARILVVAMAASLLADEPPDASVGRLKSLLNLAPLTPVGDTAVTWDVKSLLDYLKLKLRVDSYNLIEALVTAMNDRDKITELENFPVWREAKPEPLG